MTGPRRLPWLAPDAPADAFPDPAGALAHPNGLLAAGGDLSPERLLAAYRRGIFPWFSAGEPILWWCPDPRAVLLPGELHRSRSLRRSLRSGRFAWSVDQDFAGVIHLCAATREAAGTWLSPAMIAAYRELHARGFAHSVETWADGRLAGGLYGVALGGVFFGESMVSLLPDASKVAMAALARLAVSVGIELIDCQVTNPHLERMGSRLMRRAEFLAAVASGQAAAPLHRLTPRAAASTAPLAA